MESKDKRKYNKQKICQFIKYKEGKAVLKMRKVKEEQIGKKLIKSEKCRIYVRKKNLSEEECSREIN
jgi:hypothetical protein